MLISPANRWTRAQPWVMTGQSQSRPEPRTVICTFALPDHPGGFRTYTMRPPSLPSPGHVTACVTPPTATHRRGGPDRTATRVDPMSSGLSLEVESRSTPLQGTRPGQRQDVQYETVRPLVQFDDEVFGPGSAQGAFPASFTIPVSICSYTANTRSSSSSTGISVSRA